MTPAFLIAVTPQRDARVMTDAELVQIRRSLAMSGTLPAGVIEMLLDEIARLRALVGDEARKVQQNGIRRSADFRRQ